MADIQAKRAFVEAMYDSPRWRNKVRHMSDIQVTAIYLKEQAKPKPKKEKKTDDEIPF